MPEQTAAITIASGNWSVDPAASQIRFTVPNMWGLAKVKGTFDRFGGTLAVRPDSVDANFSVDASSLNTRNKRRDAHLRSKDFFHVESYPEITFEPSTVTSGESGLAIAGHLVVRDSRVRLDLPVETSENGDGIVLKTSATMSRHDAGLGWNRVGMIGSDVAVDVELRLVRKA
jgi:polyisoprenoid-binding protein YceI